MNASGGGSSASERRRLGAWYTPAALVDFVLDRAADVRGGPVSRVVDPACGDGRFLAAAARRWPDAQTVGIDLDGDAVHAARAALPDATIVHDDALARVWDDAGTYDLVVGNPPFLSQLATATARPGRSNLGGGPYADTAALFVSLALDLVRPDGGCVALVLPQSFVAVRDVAPIRQQILDEATPAALWVAGGPMFDAAVNTIVLVVQRGGQPPSHVARWFGPTFEPRPPGEVPSSGRSWSSLIADLLGVPPVAPMRHDDGPQTVGDIAVVTADFRDQYYGLMGAVVDDPEPSAQRPRLVTAGLVGVGGHSWGRRSVRFGKEPFAHPCVDLARLSEPLQAWAARRLVPKVIVATQTRVLEACGDHDGSLVPSVPVVSVVPTDPSDVDFLTAVMCSPHASAWAATRAIGAGLSLDAIKLSASQVAEIPLPPAVARPAVIDAATFLRSGDLGRYAELMGEAYGFTSPALLDWWLPRAQKARPLIA